MMSAHRRLVGRTVLLDSVAVRFGHEDVRARCLGRKGAEAPET